MDAPPRTEEATTPSFWVLSDGRCSRFSADGDVSAVFDAPGLEWPQIGVLDDHLALFCANRLEIRHSRNGTVMAGTDLPPGSRWAGVAHGLFWVQTPVTLMDGQVAAVRAFHADGSSGPAFDLRSGFLSEHRGGPLTTSTPTYFDCIDVAVLRPDGSTMFEFEEFSGCNAGAPGRLVTAQGPSSMIRSWSWSDAADEPVMTAFHSPFAGPVTSIAATTDGWVEVHARQQIAPVSAQPGVEFQKVDVIAEDSEVARIAEGAVVAVASLPRSGFVVGADSTGSWLLSDRTVARLDLNLQTLHEWGLPPIPRSFCCSWE